MQEVVQQLSQRLVSLGHEVVVATSFHSERKNEIIGGVKIKSFKISGNQVRGMEGEVNAYEDFLLESDFDIVTIFAAQQWATDIALPLLDRIKGKKVFVPTGFSGFYLPEYRNYFQKMKDWMKHFDMNVFLSNNYRDINFARENSIDKIIIIPNGAGEDEFKTVSFENFRTNKNIPANDFLILHVGSYSSIKGHREAVQIFLSSKLRNATLLLIGNNNEIFEKRYGFLIKPWLFFENLRGRKLNIVLAADYSREETVAAYISADCFLFPSNIECSPIVLFEAMAANIPFLTSDVGNSAEIIEWSGGGLLLPTRKDKKGYSHAHIKKSAAILNKIFSDDELRKKLSISGHKAWKKKFTWEKIAKQYEDLYTSLLSEMK
jgi:L-malate glycosyltransferase